MPLTRTQKKFIVSEIIKPFLNNHDITKEMVDEYKTKLNNYGIQINYEFFEQYWMHARSHCTKLEYNHDRDYNYGNYEFVHENDDIRDQYETKITEKLYNFAILFLKLFKDSIILKKENIAKIISNYVLCKNFNPKCVELCFALKNFGYKLDEEMFCDIIEEEIQENSRPSYRKRRYGYLRRAYGGRIVNDNDFTNINKLLEKKLIDFVINGASLANIMRITNIKQMCQKEEIFTELIKYYDMKPSEELYQASCKYNNTVLFKIATCDITEFNDECFMYSCFHTNIIIMTEHLNQKIIPSSEHLHNICVGTGQHKIQAIETLIDYGFVMTDKMHETIGLLGIKLTKINNDHNTLENINKLQNRLTVFNSIKKATLSQKKNYNNLKNTEKIRGSSLYHLRNLYLSYSLDHIQSFQEKYNCKPDITCFENSLMNNDPIVRNYVFHVCNYIPSILAIVRTNDLTKRIGFLTRFYPELCSIDYGEERLPVEDIIITKSVETEIKKKAIKNLDAKKKTKNDKVIVVKKSKKKKELISYKRKSRPSHIINELDESDELDELAVFNNLNEPGEPIVTV
jgi:hypothetical protein